jgi:Fur family transcriptional regulator, ferric uptake regulator
MAHKHVKEMQALVEHLGKHQLKLTRQRELILDAFLRQEHITAEAMYHQLAKSDPHLGLATIYRTLNLFCDAGLGQCLAQRSPRSPHLHWLRKDRGI